MKGNKISAQILVGSKKSCEGVHCAAHFTSNDFVNFEWIIKDLRLLPISSQPLATFCGCLFQLFSWIALREEIFWDNKSPEKFSLETIFFVADLIGEQSIGSKWILQLSRIEKYSTSSLGRYSFIFENKLNQMISVARNAFVSFPAKIISLCEFV